MLRQVGVHNKTGNSTGIPSFAPHPTLPPRRLIAQSEVLKTPYLHLLATQLLQVNSFLARKHCKLIARRRKGKSQNNHEKLGGTSQRAFSLVAPVRNRSSGRPLQISTVVDSWSRHSSIGEAGFPMTSERRSGA